MKTLNRIFITVLVILFSMSLALEATKGRDRNPLVLVKEAQSKYLQVLEISKFQHGRRTKCT